MKDMLFKKKLKIYLHLTGDLLLKNFWLKKKNLLLGAKKKRLKFFKATGRCLHRRPTVKNCNYKRKAKSIMKKFKVAH